MISTPGISNMEKAGKGNAPKHPETTPTLAEVVSSLSKTGVGMGGDGVGGRERKNSANTASPSESGDSVDAAFFDLRPPPPSEIKSKIENVMRRLHSKEHLHFILSDHFYFQRFSSFVNRYKPHMAPTLVRYMEMRKALKAIDYANAVARMIRWPTHTDTCKFSRIQAAQADVRFEDYASREITLLCSEALTAWIAHNLVSIITDCVSRDVVGNVVPAIEDLVGSLGEVFCLTDPNMKDNPIIYCSEEFYRTTQYGTSYAINRNCRFLQGPATDQAAVRRLSKALSAGQETNELILNYRRDGTPFANLLMCSPLFDDKGTIRYFIGAQVDVTGLVLDGLGLDSFRSFLQRSENPTIATNNRHHHRYQTKPPYQKSQLPKTNEALSKLSDLSLLLSQAESDIVAHHARPSSICTPLSDADSNLSDGCSISSQTIHSQSGFPAKRVIDHRDSELHLPNAGLNPSLNPSFSTLPGVYQHYLLMRPYPSLQIIFASPSLRLPGLLRTPLFTKIGGSQSTLSALEDAFRDGAAVTARVHWQPKNGYTTNGDIKRRWIRCTPLLGSDDRVGVWMVILVPDQIDDEIGRLSSSAGYLSLGGGMGVGVGSFGTSRRSNQDRSSDEMSGNQSLTEGSQPINHSSGPGTAASMRSANRRDSTQSVDFPFKRSRVMIMDHDGDNQAPLNGRHENRAEAQSNEYAQYLKSSTSNSSIREQL